MLLYGNSETLLNDQMYDVLDRNSASELEKEAAGAHIRRRFLTQPIVTQPLIFVTPSRYQTVVSYIIIRLNIAPALRT